MNGLAFLIFFSVIYYYFNLYIYINIFYFIGFIFIYLLIYNISNSNPELINTTLKGYHKSDILPIYTNNITNDEKYFKYMISQKQNWRCMYCNNTISNNNIKLFKLFNLNNDNILICPHCYKNIVGIVN